MFEKKEKVNNLWNAGIDIERIYQVKFSIPECKKKFVPITLIVQKSPTSMYMYVHEAIYKPQEGEHSPSPMLL